MIGMDTQKKIDKTIKSLALLKWAEITPEMAALLLVRNKTNRAICRSHMVRLSRAISADVWQLNGESIKFHKDGTLIDGQHRLMACVKAEKPFNTSVCIVDGNKGDIFNSIDTGRMRGGGDALSVRGVKYPMTLAAAIKTILWYYDEVSTLGTRFYTNKQIIDFFDTFSYIENICYSMFNGSNYGDARYLMTGKVMGFMMFMAWFNDDPSIQEFMARLGSPANHEKDSPILQLRLKALDIRSKKKLATGHIRFQYTAGLGIKAWNNHVQKKTIKKFDFKIGIEKFPEMLGVNNNEIKPIIDEILGESKQLRLA